MFTAFKSICGVVPGWVWALIVAGCVAWGGVTYVQLSITQAQLKTRTAERDAFSTELEIMRRNMDIQNEQAATLLAELTGKSEKAEAALKALVIKYQKERDDAQAQNTAAVRAAINGPGLRFTAPKTSVCGGGSPGTPSPASGSPSNATASAGVQLSGGVQETVQVELPKTIRDPAFELMGKAQSILIDFAKLKAWVENPSLVCELRP